MSRNIITVVVDRMISAARVRVRNDDDTASWHVDAATGCGSVAVKDMKPDGTNRMPAMDAAARAGFQKITDGANTMPCMDAAARAGFQKITDGTYTLPAGDAPARAIHTKWVPSRPASDLDAGIIVFNHGTVSANWSANSAAAVSQSAARDLWISDVSLVPTSNPTTEIQTQHVPFQLLIEDATDAQYRALLLGGIPHAAHFSFAAPLKVARGHNWRSTVKLGGATALNIYVVINGFEEA